MDDLVNLYCPVHHDVVLFRVPPAPVMSMFRLDKPAECRKCGKHYYEHECISEELKLLRVAYED